METKPLKIRPFSARKHVRSLKFFNSFLFPVEGHADKIYNPTVRFDEKIQSITSNSNNQTKLKWVSESIEDGISKSCHEKTHTF